MWSPSTRFWPRNNNHFGIISWAATLSFTNNPLFFELFPDQPIIQDINSRYNRAAGSLIIENLVIHNQKWNRSTAKSQVGLYILLVPKLSVWLAVIHLLWLGLRLDYVNVKGTQMHSVRLILLSRSAVGCAKSFQVDYHEPPTCYTLSSLLAAVLHGIASRCLWWESSRMMKNSNKKGRNISGYLSNH
jgi:hypothetical protein